MSAGPRPNTDALHAILATYVSRAIAQGVLRTALRRAGTTDTALDRDGVTEAVVKELRQGLELFLDDHARRRECVARLSELVPARSDRAAVPTARPIAPRTGDAGRSPPSTGPLAASLTSVRSADPVRPIEVAIVDENGIVDARTRARALAASLGFSTTDQYKLATAVSEVSRNIFRYVGRGTISFGPVTSPRTGMFIIARDDGPGIPDIEHVLSSSYVSKTGLGRGLQGCRRIMDKFQIDSAPGRGTTVTLMKFLES